MAEEQNSSFLAITTHATTIITRKTNPPLYITVCIFKYQAPQVLPTLYALRFYVNPIVSVLGLSANMMSVAILRRSGLHKPSNILLMGLVISDIMTQLAGINFGEILEFSGPNYFEPKICGWQYGDGVNYFLLVCDIINLLLSSLGQYVTTTISILITFERFLAVYVPLTFKRVVTKRSALAGVTVCYLLWLIFIVYYLSLFKANSEIPQTLLFYLNFRREDQYELFVLLNNYICGTLATWVPIAFIGLGCILIGVKVKVTLGRRKRMTSKPDSSSWSAKTTRTLLITCFVLFVCLIISSFTSYYSNDIPNGYIYFMQECLKLVVLLNAASNFFVYIATNKKFAKIFLDIVFRRT